MTRQLPICPSEAFARLDRIDFSETSFTDALTEIVTTARDTLPDVAGVSVTLVGAAGAHTAAYCGEQALVLDAWQYDHGHGPCLAAAAAILTVSVMDAAVEGRWPDFGERAVAVGMHSILSVGLPLYDAVAGAVNVYATEPAAFDDEAVQLARAFAGYVAAAMATAHRHKSAGGLAVHMHDATNDRALIEQAKGIIMADRHCTADEAFAILAKISHYAGRPTRDVATALVTDTTRAPSIR